jgi:DNA-binding NarL/FixJ family response regulator
MALVGSGRANKEVAADLDLSEGTVRNYISSILQKTDLRDRTQLAIFAVRNGMAGSDGRR